MNVSPTRQAILDDLANVHRWPDGNDYHRAVGREWKVTKAVAWLVDHGLIEPDPADADLDVRRYRIKENPR